MYLTCQSTAQPKHLPYSPICLCRVRGTSLIRKLQKHPDLGCLTISGHASGTMRNICLLNHRGQLHLLEVDSALVNQPLQYVYRLIYCMYIHGLHAEIGLHQLYRRGNLLCLLHAILSWPCLGGETVPQLIIQTDESQPSVVSRRRA